MDPGVEPVADTPPLVLEFGEPAREVAAAHEDSAHGTVHGTVHDPPADDLPPGGAVPTAGDADYQRRLGSRLRAVRRGHGMRLQDVEERSAGRFKAVVVGSYERGDRAIATHKLAALAAFYAVPISELLPEDDWPDPAWTTPAGVRLSVAAVRAAGDDPEATALRRVVQHVRVLRGDHHGTVLTLRGDDLRTIAVTLGVDVDDLPSWLAARGLLATP